MKTRVLDYFDKTAGVYDVKHGSMDAGQAHNFARYYRPFLSRAIPAGARVLELGCGTGLYSQWLIDRGCSVVGLDLSAKMIEKARQKSPRGTFIVGDCEDPAECLPEATVADGFDVIVGVNTFCYYPNKEQALARYTQLLRPAGKLVLIEPNGRCPFWRAMTWIDKNEIRVWISEFRKINSNALDGMLNRAGLKPSEISHFAFIPNGVGRLAVRLLGPMDAVLNRLPLIRGLAMRVALVAEKA